MKAHLKGQFIAFILHCPRGNLLLVHRSKNLRCLTLHSPSQQIRQHFLCLQELLHLLQSHTPFPPLCRFSPRGESSSRCITLRLLYAQTQVQETYIRMQEKPSLSYWICSTYHDLAWRNQEIKVRTCFKWNGSEWLLMNIFNDGWVSFLLSMKFGEQDAICFTYPFLFQNNSLNLLISW